MEERESTVSGSVKSDEYKETEVMKMEMEMERSTKGDGNLERLANKKKRERPSTNNNKYDSSEGLSMAMALSPVFSSSSHSDFSVKRSRGRPKGSGNRQLLASLGEWISNSAGGKFLPHVVTINSGEDVAAKIISFSRKGPRAICILSANGAVSNVTLRQTGSHGGILTYEGSFEILSLTGSFTVSSTGGVRSRTGGLSVSLAGPDGRVVGGAVAGLLMASSKIQVIVGSFLPNSHKSQRRKQDVESSMASTKPSNRSDIILTAARPISQAKPVDDETSFTPMPTLPEQSQGEEEEEENTSFTRMSTLPEQSHGGPENTSSIHQNRNCNNSFSVVGQHVSSRSMLDQRPSSDINGFVPGG